MSTQQTEDEWQAVEENLKALNIKEQVQSKQNKSADQPGDDNGQVESIDTALMNALLNPRERMVLFHIEDAILNFMKSNDRQMDLPQCNSFRRLLYYRLGQRFGLCHTTTDQITETGERTIVLYKTATSCFPSVLLIDLAAQYPLDPAASDGGNYNNNNNANSNNYNSGQQSPTPSANQVYSLQNPANDSSANRKVQVMKRKPARTDTSSTKSNTSSKNAQSAEDKERAYHEARARIFGDTGTPEGSTGGNSPCPDDDGEGNSNSGMCTPQSEVYDTKNVTTGNIVSGSGSVVDNISTTATRGSTPVSTSATLSNQSSSASLSALGGEKSYNTSTKEGNAAGIAEKRTTTESATVTSRTPPLTNDSYNNSTNNNNRRNNNNNNNNNNNRAQVRNIDAERSDPDFVRRSHVNRNPSGGGSNMSGGNYYNNNTSGGGNGYNNNNYNQSRQQADPRYNMNNMSNNANMAYTMDPQALYLQQQQQLQMQMQMQYNTMQQQQQGLPPANTPEAVQMQLQMQMQYQQMQLQMQMLAQQQQQQQQMMMGANPYYPNNMPAPQGYNMPNGQSSPVPPPPYGPGYGTPYNNSNNNNNNNTNNAPQYNRVNNSSKQYKNDFPPLG